MIDVFETHVDVLADELHLAGIRLNERPADVTLTKANRGGLTVNPTVKLTKLDAEMVADICREWGYLNGTVVVRQDITEDQLIDVLAGNRVFLRALVVVNKIDLVSSDYVKQLQAKLPAWKLVPISAEKGVGLTRLKDEIYSTLRFMRVFLKPQGKEADMADPMIVKQDSDVGMVCDAIHRDWRKRFRYANVWGPSAQFPGQKVGLDHPLKDADVLTIVLRKGRGTLPASGSPGEEELDHGACDGERRPEDWNRGQPIVARQKEDVAAKEEERREADESAQGGEPDHGSREQPAFLPLPKCIHAQ